MNWSERTAIHFAKIPLSEVKLTGDEHNFSELVGRQLDDPFVMLSAKSPLLNIYHSLEPVRRRMEFSPIMLHPVCPIVLINIVRRQTDVSNIMQQTACPHCLIIVRRGTTCSPVMLHTVCPF